MNKQINIIIFSSPIPKENEIQDVITILATNIVAFHLRKPNASKEEIRLFLQQIPIEFHIKIVLHQHIELLKEFSLKGFYCSRLFLENNSPKQIRKKYPKALLSRGCHTYHELTNSLLYDYVFISPVFDSISKKGYKANFDFTKLASIISTSETKVYALGGIEPSSIAKIKTIPFSGYALLGYIWYNNTLSLQYKLKQLGLC